jgi:hypothetical protein
LHRHATEEVFIPVKGRWQVFWLEGDEERTVNLDEGDVLNVPISIYRGFRSLTDAPDALLMAIIGGPDAGKVDWHPSVLEEARKTGLTVDEEGNLIIEKPAARCWEGAGRTAAAFYSITSSASARIVVLALRGRATLRS